MHISDKGLSLIKEFEGCKLTSYKCPAGVWTIGYGTTSADKSITGFDITEGMVITQERADEWLRRSIEQKYEPKVMKYDNAYHWNQSQFDALVSYAYNIGSIDKLVDYGKRTISEISDDIPNHNKASGKVLAGLTRRRLKEKELFDMQDNVKSTVDKVLKIAEQEVGYLEKSASAYKKDKNVIYDKIAGAGSDNYTKYGKEMHDIYPSVMDFPAYWCDAFVDWCFYKAYGLATAKSLLGGNFDDYTIASAQMYKNKKAWFATPKVGDQVFFHNGTKICHTGLVYKVDSNTVYTIEGNTSSGSTVVANGGCVAKKSYPINYNRIAGYGRPKYDLDAKKSGWYQEDGGWRFYLGDTGLPVKGDWYEWTSSKDGHKYWSFFLGDTGFAVVNDWYKYKDKWYFFNEDAVMLHDCWVKWKGKDYYLTSDGSMVTDTYIDDPNSDKKYYVDPDGIWISGK